MSNSHSGTPGMVRDRQHSSGSLQKLGLFRILIICF